MERHDKFCFPLITNLSDHYPTINRFARRAARPVVQVQVNTAPGACTQYMRMHML